LVTDVLYRLNDQWIVSRWEKVDDAEALNDNYTTASKRLAMALKAGEQS